MSFGEWKQSPIVLEVALHVVRQSLRKWKFDCLPGLVSMLSTDNTYAMPVNQRFLPTLSVLKLRRRSGRAARSAIMSPSTCHSCGYRHRTFDLFRPDQSSCRPDCTRVYCHLR